jgi:hypothetical protein
MQLTSKFSGCFDSRPFLSVFFYLEKISKFGDIFQSSPLFFSCHFISSIACLLSHSHSFQYPPINHFPFIHKPQSNQWPRNNTKWQRSTLLLPHHRILSSSLLLTPYSQSSQSCNGVLLESTLRKDR